MEPITTAIVAAVAAVAAVGAGLAKVGESAIVDTYTGVKNAIAKRFGTESKLKKAVDDVEANPTSVARKGVLDEEVVAAKADEDAEILQAVKLLLAALEKLERQQPGTTGVTLIDIEAAASVIIRNITTPDGGVHAERIRAESGNVEMSDIHVGGTPSRK